MVTRVLGGRGILDTEWIPRIASEKPDAIIIGGDNAILKKPHERLLLKESNLMYVIMGSNYNNLPMRDQLIRTIQIWDDLVKKTSKTKTKKIFEVIIKKKGLPVIEEISVTSELHIDERRIK